MFLKDRLIIYTCIERMVVSMKRLCGQLHLSINLKGFRCVITVIWLPAIASYLLTVSFDTGLVIIMCSIVFNVNVQNCNSKLILLLHTTHYVFNLLASANLWIYFLTLLDFRWKLDKLFRSLPKQYSKKSTGIDYPL